MAMRLLRVVHLGQKCSKLAHDVPLDTLNKRVLSDREDSKIPLARMVARLHLKINSQFRQCGCYTQVQSGPSSHAHTVNETTLAVSITTKPVS